MRILFILYVITAVFLSIFSYGFVDGNYPYRLLPQLFTFVNTERGMTTFIYSFFIIFLFILYGVTLYMIRKNKIDAKNIWILICTVSIILFFSFPAFSYDIFNYIATSKVLFLYNENPYIIMPINIANEPLLAFMHASNKIALYGPVWIALTGFPLLLGFNNIIISILSFKLFILIFYLALIWVLWNLSNKNIFTIGLFALNPLVLMETLISGHNDVVMMFFAVSSLWFLKKNKIIFSLLLLFFSILIKYATIFLVPVFIYIYYLKIKGKKIKWDKIWILSAGAMFLIFLLSPLREELYSWYFIWPFTFLSLSTNITLIVAIAISFTFGLLFRIAPFIYSNDWLGYTPIVKKIVTFIPPLLTGIAYVIKKKI